MFQIKDVNFKLEVVDLLTINLTFREDINGIDFQRPFNSTTSNLKGEINEYKINMRDILNIRTEFNSKISKYDDFIGFSRRGYEILNHNVQFYTYLATILIEL